MGSGDGRVVIAVGMRGAKAIGVESDWLRAGNDEKLEKELKKGTRVASAAFIYKGWKLLKQIITELPMGRCIFTKIKQYASVITDLRNSSLV